MKDEFKNIADRISDGLGIPGLVEILAERATGAELNSLLLAVFDRRVRGLRAPVASRCMLPICAGRGICRRRSQLVFARCTGMSGRRR